MIFFLQDDVCLLLFVCFVCFVKNVSTTTATYAFLYKPVTFLFHHRRDILDHLVTLQNFENQFLPNALRRFFSETKPPNDRGSYLQCLVDKFSDRFCQCNPQLGLSKGTLPEPCVNAIPNSGFQKVHLILSMQSPTWAFKRYTMVHKNLLSMQSPTRAFKR